MKLKKIASLALAGVMAVSMLAGCANKPADSEPTTEPTTGITADAVIKALNEKTTDKVTFTASTSLQSTLEKAVQYAGAKAIEANPDTALTRLDLVKFDSTLNKAAALYANKVSGVVNEEWFTKAENNSITRVKVVKNSSFANYNETAIVNALAKEVDAMNIATSSGSGDADVTAASLVSYTQDFGKTPDQYYYKLSYTGTMAVTKVSDTVYAVALTVTRNVAKTATPTKG